MILLINFNSPVLSSWLSGRYPAFLIMVGRVSFVSVMGNLMDLVYKIYWKQKTALLRIKFMRELSNCLDIE